MIEIIVFMVVMCAILYWTIWASPTAKSVRELQELNALINDMNEGRISDQKALDIIKSTTWHIHKKKALLWKKLIILRIDSLKKIHGKFSDRPCNCSECDTELHPVRMPISRIKPSRIGRDNQNS